MSRKISCPTQYDWVQVKQVIRYLKGTKNIKQKLGDPNERNGKQIIGYADADWAGNVTDRKSTSGYIFKYNGGTISWSSRKQSCVSLSSTEAEYIKIAEACQEATYLKNLLLDFNQINEDSVIMYEDNQSCLKLIENEKMNQRTKHIDVKYHFAKSLKESGIVEFINCPTEDMVADLFTKPLLNIKLKKFSNGLV